MAHNDQEINAEALFELLTSLSKYVERDLKMYALGGTALTILSIKNSTRDVDINIESKREYDYVRRLFTDLGFENRGLRWLTQEGLAFDLFWGSNIMGTNLLPDCIGRAKLIRSFGNIILYTLPLEDIIISKLARGDIRDFDDIKAIFEREKIDLKGLAQRYKQTMESSIVSDSRQKFLDLIEIKFKEWEFKRDDGLIREVRSWRQQ